MIRTALKRAVGYVWPERAKPLNRIAREPDGYHTVTRSPLKRAKPMRRMSNKQKLRKAKWAVITQSKIAAGLGCRVCGIKDGRGVRLCGHHRRLASQQGAWTIDNHVLLCPDCHRRVHENPSAAAAAGLIEQRKAS